MSQCPSPFICHSLFICSPHCLDFFVIQGFGLLLLEVLDVCNGVVFLLVLFKVTNALVFCYVLTLNTHTSVIWLPFYLILVLNKARPSFVSLIQILPSLLSLNQWQTRSGNALLWANANFALMIFHFLNSWLGSTLHGGGHDRVYHFLPFFISLLLVNFSLLSRTDWRCFHASSSFVKCLKWKFGSSLIALVMVMPTRPLHYILHTSLGGRYRFRLISWL